MLGVYAVSLIIENQSVGSLIDCACEQHNILEKQKLVLIVLYMNIFSDILANYLLAISDRTELSQQLLDRLR